MQSIHDQSLNPTAVKGIDPAVVSSVLSDAEAVLIRIPQSVLHVGYLDSMGKHGVYGVSIFFPGSRDSFENSKKLYGAQYDVMAFARAGWLAFLNSYWDAGAK